MSDAKTIQDVFKEYSAKINENTRTFILAFVNHNGDGEVTMAGQDLDIAWLDKLIDIRVTELIQAKRN